MVAKKGQSKGIHKTTCSRCDKPRRESHRYCKACTNAYAREWRKTHPLSPEQKIKALVRDKTKMRIKRGLLIPYPCEVCNLKKVEAHHDDYNKPYCVRWLCRPCHLNHHREVYERNKKSASVAAQG